MYDVPLMPPSWGGPCLGGLRALKEREYQGHLRIYGIEGEAGREGEGRTRIRESSRRRAAAAAAERCDEPPPRELRPTSDTHGTARGSCRVGRTPIAVGERFVCECVQGMTIPARTLSIRYFTYYIILSIY